MKKQLVYPTRFLAILLIAVFFVLTLPLTTYATDYSDVRITKLEKNAEGNITSVTISFKTTDTYSSRWCLALYDHPISRQNGLTDQNAPGDTANAKCICYTPLEQSANDTHEMTLTYADGFPSTYYVCLLIWYGKQWTRDLPNEGGFGTTDNSQLDLDQMVQQYEENKHQLAVSLIDNDGNNYVSALYSPGAAFKPTPVVTDKNGDPVDSASYTGIWEKDDQAVAEIKEPGIYTYTVTGKDAFSGSTASAVFTVTRSLTDAIITLDWTEREYSGSYQSPSIVSVVKDGKDLIENIDYTVPYAAPKRSSGSYEKKIIGKGEYSGEAAVTYQILRKDISGSSEEKMKIKPGTAGAITTSPNLVHDGVQVAGTWSYQLSAESKTIEEINGFLASIPGGESCTVIAQFVPSDDNFTGSYTKIFDISVMKEPIIITQPRTVTVYTGSSAGFSVAASGDDLSYQWQQKEKGRATWEDIEHAVKDTYAIPLVTTRHDGSQYRCIVSNDAGRVISDGALLTVREAEKEEPVAPVPPAVAPLITNESEKQTISPGEAVTFSITVDGTAPFSYQWQRKKNDETTWKNIEYATKDTYTILLVTTDQDGDQYRCVVTNAAGSSISTPSTLKIQQNPEPPDVPDIDPPKDPEDLSDLPPVDVASDETKQSPSAPVVNTGDESILLIWTGLLMLSLTALAAILKVIRKRKTSN